jgi:hypothetical protein
MYNSTLILPDCLVLDFGTPLAMSDNVFPMRNWPAIASILLFSSFATRATDRTSKRAAIDSTIVTLHKKEVITEISLSVPRTRRTALSFAMSTGTKRGCSCLRKIAANHPSPTMNSSYFELGSMMGQSGLMSLQDTNANAARTGRSNDS